jgi:hypothetical protein
MAVRISTSLSPARKAYGVVSYRGIPLYRCQAWALELVKAAGVEPVIISGIRDDAIIREHNRRFHTNLHGQQYLVDLFHAGKGNPANTPATTSHCHHGDGNYVYGAAGRNIPLVMNGIDAEDNAKAQAIVAKLNHLGFRAVCPYNTGSELHHFSLWPHHTNDYIHRLRREYAKLLIRKARARARRRKK